jgi:alkanesulfonate monooxygenase
MSDQIEIFSTCPQSTDHPEGYMDRIREVSRWSEGYGCKGILVYADNRLADPWMVSQVIIESTKKLCPLVAVQPVYMHPYTVANMVTSYGYLYERRIYLNMVAGGFKNDLIALNDSTPHDARYDRLTEYTTIISGLLEGKKPVSFKGDYYQVNNLSLQPKLGKELYPGIFISGSSEAGLNAARNLRATAIQYPHPSSEYDENLAEDTLKYGIRIGIIARDEEEEAWKTAFERFPASREGQLAHKLAAKTTDSVWYKRLSNAGHSTHPGAGNESRGTSETENRGAATSPYWLHPFKNYKTMCPYLVGNYQKVAGELARYMEIGYRTFILDIPPDREELMHTNRVFEMAKEEVTV